MGRSASVSRRQVTCSPSSHCTFTETPLAQVMRPSTPSSMQRTRLPIFNAGKWCAVISRSCFWFVMWILPVFQAIPAFGATCAVRSKD